MAPLAEGWLREPAQTSRLASLAHRFVAPRATQTFIAQRSFLDARIGVYDLKTRSMSYDATTGPGPGPATHWHTDGVSDADVDVNDSHRPHENFSKAVLPLKPPLLGQNRACKSCVKGLLRNSLAII